ncbi:MAG: hypothetical protein K9J79_01430 [Desulfobacteraceae bacterium]|nr:hypothetical protein [Desulfobacteraceae bacterium]
MSILGIIKAVAVLLAAGILGNWFLAELKKSKMRKEPWYKPYLSPPGLLIYCALLLPLIVWIAGG